VLAVPALDDPPIPIGATVTVHYDNREIDGELLGMALGDAVRAHRHRQNPASHCRRAMVDNPPQTPLGHGRS